ncbi:hypothetical protein EJB05_30021, partial [Eragrostis curvula]
MQEGGTSVPPTTPSATCAHSDWYYSHDQTSAAPPRPHQQAQGPHGVTAGTAGIAALDQYILNFKSTSMVTYGAPPSFAFSCLYFTEILDLGFAL